MSKTGLALDPTFARHLLQSLTARPTGAADTPTQQSAVTHLTERQRAVALLVAEGMTNGEIAARLFVSNATVKATSPRFCGDWPSGAAPSWPSSSTTPLGRLECSRSQVTCHPGPSRPQKGRRTGLVVARLNRTGDVPSGNGDRVKSHAIPPEKNPLGERELSGGI
ncbi:LuxR C-terminal-related transcriptional regulator [Microbacterium sp. DT81.1]|uniref:helix-turn-helix domain-containing protein n=1 Tax=Microbacterium sp. DT81.1 TaxID=3393413 RepID=UPI003CEC7D8D